MRISSFGIDSAFKFTLTQHIHKHAVSARIQKTHQGKKYKFSRLRLTLKLKVDQKRILTKIGLSIYFSSGASFHKRVSLILILATANKTRKGSLYPRKNPAQVIESTFVSFFELWQFFRALKIRLWNNCFRTSSTSPTLLEKLFSRRKKNISCMLTRVDGSPTSRDTRLIKRIMLINILSQKIGIVFRKKKKTFRIRFRPKYFKDFGWPHHNVCAFGPARLNHTDKINRSTM